MPEFTALEKVSEIASLNIGISLVSAWAEGVKGTSQEIAYEAGYFKNISLDSNPSVKHCHLLVNPFFLHETLPHNGTYSFIIQKTNQGFELYLGQNSHYFIAQKALSVIAAGDIYFSQGFIRKITDQSGCYHLKAHDPAYEQKRRQALAAMQDCGLPMTQFQSFQEPIMQPLTFGFSRPIEQQKTKVLESMTNHPYKALAPQVP